MRTDIALTDSGLETELLFLDGIDLPHFASYPLLLDPTGRQRLARYYREFVELAEELGRVLVLETPTWRANPDWGARLGHDPEMLAAVDADAVALLREVSAGAGVPVVVSGNLGPRGDGYDAGIRMDAEEAEAYHRPQVEAFSAAGADRVTVLTTTYVEEAVGIVRAASAVGIPVVASFTVETDGRLPTGQTLQEAIEAVDEATGGYPAYYMINCAHPAHFAHALDGDEGWIGRIRGLRANASRKSHAELDGSRTLDTGNPAELGLQYAGLKRRLLPALNVIGGCCGTDHRHIEQMAAHCAPLFARAA